MPAMAGQRTALVLALILAALAGARLPSADAQTTNGTQSTGALGPQWSAEVSQPVKYRDFERR